MPKNNWPLFVPNQRAVLSDWQVISRKNTTVMTVWSQRWNQNQRKCGKKGLSGCQLWLLLLSLEQQQKKPWWKLSNKLISGFVETGFYIHDSALWKSMMGFNANSCHKDATVEWTIKINKAGIRWNGWRKMHFKFLTTSWNRESTGTGGKQTAANPRQKEKKWCGSCAAMPLSPPLQIKLYGREEGWEVKKKI